MKITQFMQFCLITMLLPCWCNRYAKGYGFNSGVGGNFEAKKTRCLNPPHTAHRVENFIHDCQEEVKNKLIREAYQILKEEVTKDHPTYDDYSDELVEHIQTPPIHIYTSSHYDTSKEHIATNNYADDNGDDDDDDDDDSHNDNNGGNGGDDEDDVDHTAGDGDDDTDYDDNDDDNDNNNHYDHKYNNANRYGHSTHSDLGRSGSRRKYMHATSSKLKSRKPRSQRKRSFSSSMHRRMHQSIQRSSELDNGIYHATLVPSEDKRIAGCLLHCIYAKNKAIDKLGWPTLDGLVDFYSEGVNEHGYFMATLRAVNRCLRAVTYKYHVNRFKEPEHGESCDLAFDVFDCISDQITGYCIEQYK